VAAAKAFFRKALKRQGSAPRSITLAGIELLRRIYKRQSDRSKLRITGSTAPEIWNKVLEA
jgi:transposase-like protein